MRFLLIGFTLLIGLSGTPTAFAGTVDTLDIYSFSMHKPIRCLVIRPNAYTTNGPAYPVVYLLHGWSGNYAGWLTEAPHLQDLVDTYQMLLVCPDGGYDSWYVDSPVDSTVRYETHITTEVVPYIDYYYNTLRAPSARAITGLSMGGHGAMYLAARHPEVFGAAGSMAGGLDLRPFRKNDWDIEGVLGDPGRYWANWESSSVVNLVDLFKKNRQALIIDCGVDDFFIEPNRTMHRLLLEADVPHEYTERPGEHNRDYWSSAVDFQLLFFDKFFAEK